MTKLQQNNLLGFVGKIVEEIKQCREKIVKVSSIYEERETLVKIVWEIPRKVVRLNKSLIAGDDNSSVAKCSKTHGGHRIGPASTQSDNCTIIG